MSKYFLCFILSLVALLVISTLTAAHEGHEHAPDDGEVVVDTQPILISSQASQNLQLKVEEAQLQTIESVLPVIGKIEAIPQKSAALASRITGRVSALKVMDGAKVVKGQALIEVESLQAGDPPPRVEYKSPIDGIVIDRHTALGDTVDLGKHLLEIADLSQVYVAGRIFEGQVSQVKIGQKVRLKVESYPDKIFEGQIDLMSGALDPETTTLTVWASVPNSELLLRPNMRALISIVTDVVDSVVAIPRAAVLGEAGAFFAFVQSDQNHNQFEKRILILGHKDDRYIEVIEGILPGDKVVTSGNYQLQYVRSSINQKNQ